MLFTLSRFRLGPMYVAVRLVVSRLRGLLLGSRTGGAALVSVTEPNGAQPSSPPSANVYVATGVPPGGGAVSVITTSSR